MPDDKQNPPVVAEEEILSDPNAPALTVDLDKPIPEAPKAPSTEDLMKKMDELAKANDALRNQVRATYRNYEYLKKQVEQPKAALVPEKVAPQLDDETARLTELKPWETPLRKMMREESERLLQEKEEARQKETRDQERVTESTRSQQFVLEKYPDLSKDDSELTELYLSVVNSHPEWHRDPFGPVRSMLEMEKLAKEQGFTLPAQRTSSPTTESARRVRASTTSLPPGRSIPTGDKITLSKEQAEFIRINKIPAERYAKSVHGLTQSGGVEA